MIHFGKEEVLTALWDISTKQLSYRFTAILELPENLKTNWIYHNKKGESLKLSPSCTQTRGRRNSFNYIPSLQYHLYFK